MGLLREHRLGSSVPCMVDLGYARHEENLKETRRNIQGKVSRAVPNCSTKTVCKLGGKNLKHVKIALTAVNMQTELKI